MEEEVPEGEEQPVEEEQSPEPNEDVEKTMETAVIDPLENIPELSP